MVLQFELPLKFPTLTPTPTDPGGGGRRKRVPRPVSQPDDHMQAQQVQLWQPDAQKEAA